MFIDGPANGMVLKLQGEPTQWEVAVPSRSAGARTDADLTVPRFSRCSYERLPLHPTPTTPSGYTLYVWDGGRQ